MSKVIFTQQIGQVITKELEEILNSIMSGKIEMPLATQDGETICTQDGVEIYATKTL